MLALILFALNRSVPNSTARPLIIVVISFLIEAFLLLILLVLAFRVGDHITKIGAPPYVDDWLAATDMALGINWIGYFEWIHARPNLHPMLRLFYDEVNWAIAAVVVCFAILGRFDRVRFFVEAFVICAGLSILFGAFLPARGAPDFWVYDAGHYSNFVSLPGVFYLDALEYVRQPGPVVIGNGALTGLVTFPSLHTAIGVLIIIACWRSLLVIPAVFYSSIMIPATPVWGGHYFSDLIGGTIMALGVAAVLIRSPAFSQTFARRQKGLAIPVARGFRPVG